MRISTGRLFTTAGFLLLATQLGCSEKALNTVGGGGAGGADVADIGVGGAGGGAGEGGAGDDAGTGLPTDLPAVEGICSDAQPCRGDATCVLGVCIDTLPADEIDVEARFSCDEVRIPESRPNLSCWGSAPELVEGPETVRAHGLVKFFGEGDKTIGLDVKVYDYSTFNPAACLHVADGERDVVRARLATETCIDEHNVPLAATITVECDPAEIDSGCYDIADLPTNRSLVVRVTGDPNLWVPTYQYGIWITPCQAPARPDPGMCPRQVSEDIAAQDWSCSLNEDGEYEREMTVISQSTWTSFPPTAGISRITEGNGALAGRMYDCDGRSLINATFGVQQAGTKTTYFNGNADDVLPQPGRVRTNLRGTYSELNMPAGPNTLAAVAWQDDVLKLVAYAPFFLLPNTIVMINPAGRAPVWSETPF